MAYGFFSFIAYEAEFTAPLRPAIDFLPPASRQQDSNDATNDGTKRREYCFANVRKARPDTVVAVPRVDHRADPEARTRSEAESY